ncbi:MAG: peptidoglycan-binding protein [Pseudomonadales bacterium]|nr:peptidoglycan-binding protein [Pseudomonadales bacterium]
MERISITGSVGIKGTNQFEDILTIQKALNTIWGLIQSPPTLIPDGKLGFNPSSSKTVAAIKLFQKNVVGLSTPDGRIDPGGKSLRTLNSAMETEPKILFPNTSVVEYKSGITADKRIVSQYAMNVIHLALQDAGMTKAVITSTLRTPKEQASIMYRNAAINVQAQFRLYGWVGDKVLKEYVKYQSTKTKDEIIAFMEAKILSELKAGRRTSKHCVSKAVYSTTNIIDIGLNSTRVASGHTFNAKKFTQAIKDLKAAAYIDVFYDETNKSNQCWHIEVTPNKKLIKQFAPIYRLNTHEQYAGYV